MNAILLFLATFFSLTPHLLLPPVAEFNSRITKKTFGLYVTPQSSPVSPEKFTGFHTGVDVEYGDASAEVPVTSVGAGKIIYSGWVSGYGGVVAQKLNYQNQDYVALYGHLNPSSLIPKDTDVSAGQNIGVLGKAYSSETDGERRHLHLAFIKGSVLNLKGYVQSKSYLYTWVDPLSLFNSSLF